jgi:hypothetical protein
MWRKFHYFIQEIESWRNNRYIRHGRNNTIFWLENLKGRGQSEDLGVDGKIILECK